MYLTVDTKDIVLAIIFLIGLMFFLNGNQKTYRVSTEYLIT